MVAQVRFSEPVKHFLTDPARLVGTVWLHRPIMASNTTTVEVIDVEKSDIAVLRGLTGANRNEAPTIWRAPLANMLIEDGAFMYIGEKTQYEWVKPNAWGMAIPETNPETQLGVWRIESCNPYTIYMYVRPITLANQLRSADVNASQTQGLTTNWLEINRRFRPATEEEIRIAQAEAQLEAERRATASRPPMMAPPPPTEDQPAPDAWEVLGGEGHEFPEKPEDLPF
jgi:hypothetical protein